MKKSIRVRKICGKKVCHNSQHVVYSQARMFQSIRRFDDSPRFFYLYIPDFFHA